MEQDKNEYKTSDFSLAIALCYFSPMLRVEKAQSNLRKARFVFIRTPEHQELIESYWNGSLRVEPKRYFNNMKLVKARMYEALQ